MSNEKQDKSKQKGQSLVELVFAIGVAGLVLTGAVVLLLNSLGSQSKKFDHKRASDIASMIMEDLVADKNNDPLNFWKNSYEIGPNQGVDGYPGYTYHLVYTRLRSVNETGCRDDIVSCARVTVTVKWLWDDTKDVEMSRFFSRN